MRIRAFAAILFVFVALCGETVRAQSSPSVPDIAGLGPGPDTTRLVVRRIRFAGNENATRSFLWRTMRTRPNREFLSIPGFTPWYWMWKRNPKRGEPPSYVVKSLLARDLERIKAYYINNGFFDVQVIPRVTEFEKGKAEVSFEIKENLPSSVRSINFRGFPSEIDSKTLKRFLRAAPVQKKLVSDSSYVVNRRYSADFINSEQNRLVNFLRDHGYAAVTRDSVKAQVTRSDNDENLLNVTFDIKKGPKYTFGNVYVRISNPVVPPAAAPVLDTIRVAADAAGAIIVQKDQKQGIRNYVIANQIRIPPGGAFSQAAFLETTNRFQGIRSLRLKRFNLSEDGSLPDYTTDTVLPAFFELSTVPKYQLGAELFGMQRVGFGAGAGLRFSNNNLFHRAHRLEFGVNGNFEYVSQTNQLLQSLDASIDYVVPNLSFPFNWLDDRNPFLFSETQFQIGAAKVKQINFDVNANVKFNWRFNLTHSRSMNSSIDFMELDLLDAEPTPAFLTELDELVLSGRIDQLQRNLILNDYNPQANSAFRYTWRDVTTNVVQRNSGHFFEYAAEISGNLPYLSDRFIVTPGTIEGHLPSFVGSANNLVYSQFVKFSGDHRNYIPVNEATVLAIRLFGGYAYPFAGNLQLPINRRFFAGGSNDIRGWFPLRLGPGAFQDQSAINGGEIKLLTSLEIRETVARDFLSSNWILTLFSDAGNVWQNPRTATLPEAAFRFDRFYNQIAVGGGYGLRIDWEFVVFRIEMAYRVHDLAEGWFKQTRILKDGTVQFGIGHAF